MLTDSYVYEKEISIPHNVEKALPEEFYGGGKHPPVFVGARGEEALLFSQEKIGHAREKAEDEDAPHS